MGRQRDDALKRVDALQQELQHVNAALDETRNALDRTSDDVKAQVSLMTVTERERAGLLKQQATLEQALQDARQTAQDVKMAHDEAMQQVQREVASVRQDLDSELRRAYVMQQQLEEVTRAKERLEAEVASLNDNLQQTRGLLDNTAQDLTTQLVSTTEAERERAALMQQRTAMEQALAEAIEVNEAATTEYEAIITEWAAKHDAAVRERDELADSLARTQAEAQGASRERETLALALLQAERDLVENSRLSSADAGRLSTRVQQLEHELADYRAEALSRSSVGAAVVAGNLAKQAHLISQVEDLQEQLVVDTGSAPRAVQPPSLTRQGDPARLHSSQSRSARAGDASSRDAVRIQMHPREGGRGEDASRGSGGSGSLMFDLSIASPPAVAVSSSGRARGRRGEGSSLGAAAPASGPGSTSAGTLGGLEGDSHSHSHSREGLDTRLDSGSSFMSPGSATGSPAPRQEPRQLLEALRRTLGSDLKDSEFREIEYALGLSTPGGHAIPPSGPPAGPLAGPSSAVGRSAGLVIDLDVASPTTPSVAGGPRGYGRA